MYDPKVTSARYKATRADGCPIITVIAQGEEDAREQITAQLSRPGRLDFLKAWKADGEQIKRLDD
jgi:hypothetical protein